MTAIIDTLHERHRIRSAHRCSCGWEGDNATVHIIDAMRVEQVGWRLCIDHDRLFSGVDPDHAGRCPECDPVYVIQGDANGSTSEGQR